VTHSVHVPAGPGGFSAEQAKILDVRGLSLKAATAAGIVPVQTDEQLRAVWSDAPDYWTAANGYLPGLLFKWLSPLTGAEVWQLRPDVAPVGADGDLKKYVFPPESPSILHRAWLIEHTDTVLIVEGSCQSRAAGAYAPDGVEVYGLAGCQSWLKAGLPSRDLAVVEGKRVLIALDADAASNRSVYDAGMALREAVMAEGASEVFFLRVPGGRKTGLDDVLGDRPEASRAAYLARLVEQAVSRPKSEKPGQPAQRRPERKTDETELHPDAIFDADGKLRVATLSRLVIGQQPAALTREQRIAMYSDGVYRIDGLAFISSLTELLGEGYRPAHRAACEEYTAGVLSQQRAYLPDRLDRPLLNVRNGMLDLRTGELLPHDPSYLSITQFPVEWRPDATCPTYDAWAAEMIGSQLDDLEETVSMMLDPSLTPTKAVFLFGPTRSGKSTFLRLMVQVAGQQNVSAVTLHKLVSDKFAAANVFGMTLNVAADLSAQHIDDLDTFKLMTGEDPITADRKYGKQFTFTNGALFAFSANELPTVGESSNAYVERIKPFRFGRSFAGHEDPTIEQRMMNELPGILVRWVAAYQRRRARGAFLPTDPAIRAEFEMASDRVRQWLATCCEVTPVDGTTGAHVSTTSFLHQQFKQWVEDEGRTGMARSKFANRLLLLPGVVECRDAKRVRGLNIRVKPREEWGQLDVAEMVATITGGQNRGQVTGQLTETDSSDSGSENADNSGTSGGQLGKLGNSDPSSSRRGMEGLQVNDHGLETPDPTVGEDRKKLPNLPTSHNGQNGHATPAALASLIATEAAGDTPRCGQCDGPTVLVDGTWYSCPACHPTTVR
jgi:putative DNA primase/helicase